MKPQSPAAAAPVGEAPTAESLGWQLRSALPPLRLNSVSLCDTEGDVLWLSEGALGPDEHSVVVEAIAALQADTSLPYFEYGMEDGRLAVFLAVRAPKGDLVGLAMILADMKTVPDGVIERLVTPQVRTILQKVAVLLRAKSPTGTETGATVAMPTPPGTPGVTATHTALNALARPTAAQTANAPVLTQTGESLAPNVIDEILTLELSPEPLAPAPALNGKSSTTTAAAPSAKPSGIANGKAPAAGAPAARPNGAAQPPSAPAVRPAPVQPPAAAKPAAPAKAGGKGTSLLSQVMPASAMAELEFTIETQAAEQPVEESTAEVPAVSEEFVLSIADTGMMQVVPAAASKAPAAKAAAAPKAAPPVATPAMPAPATAKATAAKVAAVFEDAADDSAAGADLVLHVQELIKLRSNGRTRRYEVLARSRSDAAREEVPAAFVADSAQGQAGAVLDGFVVQRLLTWLGEHGDVVWDSEPASFSINLSIGALEDPKFIDRIGAALSASEVPPEHIGFEITEFACVQCKPQVQRFVETAEQLGCFLVLDNFTFDPRSVGLLGSSALRAVKIDPKLTNIAMKDKLSQAIVVAIAQACKVMGVHCVAKRIDSQAALQWLTAVGCDFAQGYALEKPLPIDTLLAGPAPKRK